MKALIAFLMVAAAALGLEACGSGGTGEISMNLGASGNAAVTQEGGASLANLSVPTGEIEAVNLTVKQVKVHVSGADDDDGVDDGEDGTENDDGDLDDGEEDGWVVVADFGEGQTFDLLDLRNCLLERLGSASLPSGQHVTQIRLVLGERNVIVMEGVEYAIKVPSGQTSGLKINPQGPIEIEDSTVHVTLMIDLEKSFVFTGSGQIHLKPVIKATVGGETADAFISGQVTAAADDSPLAGATVTARSAEDAEVESSEETDEDGNYELCVAPGSYDVTASEEGFQDATTRVDVGGEETETANFRLEAL